MEAFSGLPTPPRTPRVDMAARRDAGAGSDAGAGAQASPLAVASIVGGFDKTPTTSANPASSERAAARRKKAGDSPLAALLRSHTSYPCLPAIKTGMTTPLACRTPPPAPLKISSSTTPQSQVETSPSSSSRRTRSYSDLSVSGCSTPLSRSSDPISIPPARIASLLGHEAALMEELSSAESHGASRRNSGGSKTTSTTATSGTTTTSTTSTAFPGTSLSGSLRDIQTLMDKQGQAGAARLLAELAAAQAERDALASDAAVLKAAAERAERGAAVAAAKASQQQQQQQETCCCHRGGGGTSCGCSCSQQLREQELQQMQMEQSRPLNTATPPPTFLFDDLDLGPPAVAAAVETTP